MAIRQFNITVPAPGEPIDLTFMTTLAEYIKQINQYMIAERQSYSSIWTGDTGLPTKIETEDVSIWTGTSRLNTIPKGQPDIARTWTVNFGANVTFNTIPMVVVTPRLSTANTTPSSCWVTNVTQSSATGRFKFIGKTTTDETPIIHVIAIGAGAANIGW